MPWNQTIMGLKGRCVGPNICNVVSWNQTIMGLKEKPKFPLEFKSIVYLEIRPLWDWKVVYVMLTTRTFGHLKSDHYGIESLPA